MKKINLIVFSLLSMLGFSQEHADKEMQLLIQREISNYQKMANVNNINPNTLNYDLTYQRMDVELDPAQYHISGSVTSHFKPKENLSSIYFDLTKALTVSEVHYHGQSLNFQQLNSNELKIDFQNTLNANVLDSLTIHYSGAPSTDNQAFSTSYQNGIPVLYTLSEPYGAKDWFPTKQSLNDKIDEFDFKITTPAQYDVAANGKLMSEIMLPNNKKLTFWRTKYPTTAYLIALSITQFEKLEDTMGNPPFPFVNYVYNSTANNANLMERINWTKQAMLLFEEHFGPYPFRDEKYGHMEFSFSGVCMEHQTMSSMSSWGKYVIAHELGHQWFGDKLTCKSWNDIWLNEGFASFSEHLVHEKLLLTHEEFLSYLRAKLNYITSQPGGSTYVSDNDLNNIGVIFSGRLSYTKGAYILRMMKWILGDDVFYQAVREYQDRPELAYNYVSTDEFKASILESTGVDFTEFLNDWLYGQGYPTYMIEWNQSSDNQYVTFNVNQSQSHPSVDFFEMPLPIKLTGTNGEEVFLRLDNTTQNQDFTEQVNFEIANVELNYEYQIIEKNSTVTKNTNLNVDIPAPTPIDEELGIFDIPAGDDITVRGLKEPADYKIYYTTGQLVKQGKCEPNQAILVKDLTPGTYIFSILGENFKLIKK